jgi:hypothetical protein
MKKLPVFFIALISVIILVMACKKEDEVKLDFDLTVPDNWAAYIFANEGYIYDARRIPEDEEDTITEGLVIYKSKATGGTLQLYYSSLLTEIKKSVAYDSMLYDTDTLINGTNFMKLLSHEKLRYINPVYFDTFFLNAVTERYFFYANNYGYNMTFLAVDTAYPSAKVVFDQIIGSFHYKE